MALHYPARRLLRSSANTHTLADRYHWVVYYGEPGRPHDYLEFVYLHIFERTAEGLLSGEEMKAAEDELLENPQKGSIQAGTGGVRKMRAGVGGRGKSGGARIVYLYVPRRQTIYFILAFSKNVQANLTAEQKKVIRRLVHDLKGGR
jgi:hypothetical protein